MADLATAARLISTGARIALARWRRGPQRPGWSWRTETAAMFIKGEFNRTRHVDLPTLRAHVDRMALPPLPPHRVPTRRGRLGGLGAGWLTPPGAPADRRVLYLHGGGYVFGSLRSHGAFLAHLASRAGLEIVAPKYRLAPEHPFPAALDDAEAAYHALLDEGQDPARLVVAGESAGGGLAAALLLRARHRGWPLPAAAALVSPWVDHTFSFDSIEDNAPDDFADLGLARRWSTAYLDGADPRDPRVSPLFADPTDLAGLPPLLLQCGGAEMLRDEARAFAQRARAAGVTVTLDEWPDMFHVWQFGAPALPEATAAVQRLARYIADGCTG